MRESKIRLVLALLLFALLLNQNAFSQKIPPPPKAGLYKCLCITFSMMPNYQPKTSVALNTTKWDFEISSVPTAFPSPFNIFLDGKTNYAIKYRTENPPPDSKGLYKFNPLTGRIAFPRVLEKDLAFNSYFLNKNGEPTLQFIFKPSSFYVECTLYNLDEPVGKVADPRQDTTTQKIRPNKLTTFKRSEKNQLVEELRRKGMDQFDLFGMVQTTIPSSEEHYRNVMALDIENFDDVAASMTYIVALGYLLSSGETRIPHHRIKKMYNQFVKLLTDNPKFLSLSDADKQLMLEKIILDGVELFDSRYLSTNEETCLKILMKYLGDKAKRLRITDNGMEF